MSIYGGPEVVFPTFADKSSDMFTGLLVYTDLILYIYILKPGKLALEKPTQIQHVKGAF